MEHSPEESAPLLKTEPVIPNPINSKFKSTPLEQGSVSPSMLISNSEGSIFQPRGGIPFQKEKLPISKFKIIAKDCNKQNIIFQIQTYVPQN